MLAESTLELGFDKFTASAALPLALIILMPIWEHTALSQATAPFVPESPKTNLMAKIKRSADNDWNIMLVVRLMMGVEREKVESESI